MMAPIGTTPLPQAEHLLHRQELLVMYCLSQVVAVALVIILLEAVLVD
jgi:hypothetical protein